MHVERYGHGGAPIVLLHGFGTSSFLWRNVAPEIALANRTAFAIDLFGYGESDRPFDADFGIAAQAELVDRALTALRLPKATVVGVDLGGAVALRLAASRPERVERLLLINPIALDEIPAGDITDAAAQHGAVRLPRFARHPRRRAHPRRACCGAASRTRRSMPDKLVARYLAPYVGEEGLNHLLLLARSIDDEDMEDAELGSLPQPTLIVWGDQDPWVDREVRRSARRHDSRAAGSCAFPGWVVWSPRKPPRPWSRCCSSSSARRRCRADAWLAGESTAPEL